MDVGDAAGDRVVDRDHGEVGTRLADGGKTVLEGRARQDIGLGIDFSRSDLGVGAELALEGDGSFGRWHRMIWTALRFHFSASGLADRPTIRKRYRVKSSRARARSAGVSTPSGTASTMATSIRMPASSALSCSSLSRISSGEG